MKEISLGKLLIGFFVLCVLLVGITAKISGASNIPELVEKDGYCKILKNQDWDYSEKKLDCFNFVNSTQRFNFTQDQFREVCPKHKLLSLRFYSDCFHSGESR